ncbi:polyketide cyclase [Mumia zhuanghuii]|uniref:SRPBCC family protein n=2 Tax=Mumia TaxID=1546255 RepID=A0ABW1QKV3_9ACTN|nr:MULTISPECIES: SRPBCC family protein [Mumia]KAA1419923.1 polyketide cyclase [Mumia zhuanghuii]
MRYEVQVDVAAPAEVAWSVLADPSEWPLITDSFIKVTPKGAGGLVVGQRYVVRQPSMRAMSWRVTEVEEGVGFTWRATVLGVRTEASHRVVARETGARFELVLEQTGLLAGMTGAIGGTHYRALVDREAATFAGAAEHRAR